MDWITLISELIIPILGLILTVAVVPYLKERHSEQLALSAVRAAEQLLGAGRGEEKYSLAEGLLVGRGVKQEDAARLIEAAVFELNRVAESIAEE